MHKWTFPFCLSFFPWTGQAFQKILCHPYLQSVLLELEKKGKAGSSVVFSRAKLMIISPELRWQGPRFICVGVASSLLLWLGTVQIALSEFWSPLHWTMPCHWVLKFWKHLTAYCTDTQVPSLSVDIQHIWVSTCGRALLSTPFLSTFFCFFFFFLSRKFPLIFWGVWSRCLYNTPFLARIIMCIWTLNKNHNNI